MKTDKTNDIKHSCIMEEYINKLETRIKELENKNCKYEILKIMLTPKMFLAACLGLSFLIQVCGGG
ncbi:hypothetical protein N9924_00820 [bacterium]|nr:hypothetical protein [bacterium]